MVGCSRLLGKILNKISKNSSSSMLEKCRTHCISSAYCLINPASKSSASISSHAKSGTPRRTESSDTFPGQSVRLEDTTTTRPPGASHWLCSFLYNSLRYFELMNIRTSINATRSTWSTIPFQFSILVSNTSLSTPGKSSAKQVRIHFANSWPLCSLQILCVLVRVVS